MSPHRADGPLQRAGGKDCGEDARPPYETSLLDRRGVGARQSRKDEWDREDDRDYHGTAQPDGGELAATRQEMRQRRPARHWIPRPCAL